MGGLKKQYNEEGIQRLIEDFGLKNKTLKGALEEIGTESDAVAEKLGPEIQERLISGCSDKWFNLCTLVGGSISLLSGFYPIYKFLNPADTFDIEYGLLSAIGATLPGMLPGMFLGQYLTKRLEKREIGRLKAEYPSKVEDIERMMELKAQYNGLLIVSTPPIG